MEVMGAFIREARRFLAFMVLVMGIASLFMYGELWRALVAVVVFFVMWPPQVENDSTKNSQIIENSGAESSLGKARADYAAIQEAIGCIPDRAMAAQLQNLQAISARMLQYLNSHPQRIPTAAQFIDYYQDRTAGLVRQYLSLKETGMQTEALEKLQKDMRTTFQGFTVAYEQQFARVIDGEVMDMDAEMKVARQVMQGEGIDCKEMEMQAQQKVEATVIEEQKKESGGWNWKQAGMVVGAFVLGAFGAYKVMGKDDKGKSN